MDIINLIGPGKDLSGRSQKFYRLSVGMSELVCKFSAQTKEASQRLGAHGATQSHKTLRYQ